jgi:hypothetical protein
MGEDDEVTGEAGDIDDLPSDPAPFGAGRRGLPFPSVSGGYVGAPMPVFQPTASTSLEEDPTDCDVPQPALWVMKYRRHISLHKRARDEIRDVIGTGDSSVCVIDDGEDDVMITREVGVDEQEVSYYLVGRLPLWACQEYADGRRQIDEIFSDASELALCSVYAALDAVSNVTVVEQYKK